MTEHTRPAHHTPASPQRKALGLSFLALLGLAALGVPRVILHDLHIIQEGDLATWLLAIGPAVVWITVAVAKRVPRPFLTVLVIGALFGAMLVITHQLLWDAAFAGDPPSIGTSPAGTLLPRLAAIPSGLITGTIIGAIAGLIAWGIQSATRRTTPPQVSGDS